MITLLDSLQTSQRNVSFISKPQSDHVQHLSVLAAPGSIPNFFKLYSGSSGFKARKSDE
jgi:hypothetical protein